MIKRMQGALFTLVMLFSLVGNVWATERKGFSLIDYLETNEISSKEEFYKVIEDNTGDIPMTAYMQSLTYTNDCIYAVINIC